MNATITTPTVRAFDPDQVYLESKNTSQKVWNPIDGTQAWAHKRDNWYAVTFVHGFGWLDAYDARQARLSVMAH